MIQYKMFSIRRFRTIITKIDKATGERFIYGNERLVTGGAMRRLFRRVGVDGRSWLLRLLPTALARQPSLVRVADALENIGVGAWFPPASIHCVYIGTKRVAGRMG